VDDKLGDLTSAANFAWVAQGHSGAIVLGQGQSFTFSYTTTPPLNAGTVVNTVTVGGSDDEGDPASTTDSHTLTVTDVAPSIAVAKTGPTTIAEGDTATFNFTITNTSVASTDPVTVTSVVDDVLGDLTAAANAAWLAQGHGGPIVLAPGQTFSFNVTTLAALNAGTVVNTVTVRGHDDEGTPAGATDTATVALTDVAPTIPVAKTAPATVAEGNTVPYGFAITTTSPASTDPVAVPSVVDDKLGDLTAAASAAWLAQGHGGPIVLPPGADFSFDFTTATA